MSLKAFHIFFIAVSILFSFGFGIWSLHSYFEHGAEGMLLWLGVGAFLIGAGLIVYGIKVFQKLQSL